MELELIKVEEGLCDGRVLFHALVDKDPQQAQQQQTAVDDAAAAAAERERARVARRRQQVSPPTFRPVCLCRLPTA